MEKIDLLTLISLIVAVVVILKLRSVLGRRTGDEEARLERYRAERRQQGTGASATDNVVSMPRRDREGAAAGQGQEVALADAEERIRDYPGIDADVRRGLLDIAKVDPAFDPEAFIRGARQAYEMIVTAFAEGNRKILKDLLNRDVYDGFVRAIFKNSLGDAEVAALVNVAKRMPNENSIALLSYPFPRSHWKEIVHAIKKPLLYVVTPQFEEQAWNLQRNRPGTQIEIFKGAGHALFIDEAERFNELIMGFAQSLSHAN